MKRHIAGFTLVELMVVVALVSILSAVMYFNISQGSAQSRDVERRADLREVQSALELYKNKYGVYPQGCNGANIWSGEAGSQDSCSSGGQYIVGLAPEFLPSLPTDPRLNPDEPDSGYVYTANAAGTVYKFMIKNTVESETVTFSHPFASCDLSNRGQIASACDPLVSGSRCDQAICDTEYSNSNGSLASNQYRFARPSGCIIDVQYGKSYAVWGGFAVPESQFIPNTESYTVRTEALTEQIACEI